MSYFALIPAGGGGTRMGAEIPKQYLMLAGRPLIRHSIETLLSLPEVLRVFVVLAPDDAYWSQFDWAVFGERLLACRCGGATRAESVANGLAAIETEISEDDWVLVHDAARPCLTRAQLEKLLLEVAGDPVGGLLAVPVADTLKRGQRLAKGEMRVAATTPREGLWQAQTPQMFRYGMLRRALAAFPEVTDEASAIEATGRQPLLVPADATNFKVTWPLDLRLAELIVRAREN